MEGLISSIPPNLTAFHEGEEGLRAEAIKFASRDSALSAHLKMIERSMDLLHNLLLPFDKDNHDHKCLSTLIIRLFNGLAATLKLSLSGYYQVAATQVRDIFETAQLLDYFGTDPTLMHQWATASKKDRHRRFSPIKVRMALDERDQTNRRERGAVYEEFCKLAAHPTPDSARMLMSNEGDPVMNVGPFFDAEGLRHILYETALCGLQAASFCRRLRNAHTLPQLKSAISFHEQMQRWFNEIHGIEPNLEVMVELERLLVEQEARI